MFLSTLHRSRPAAGRGSLRQRSAHIEALEPRFCLSALAFLPPAQYVAGPGYIDRRITVGDFNRDGKPDMVVTDFNAQVVTVLLNKGDGTFTNGGSFTTPSLPYSIANGDFNRDGKLDLAIGETSGGLLIYLGLGAGKFTQPTVYSVGGTPITIVVADFNGDAAPDLAFTRSGSFVNNVSTVSVMLNQGTGTFGGVVNYPIIGYAQSLTVDDFDRDHVWDLAVVAQDSNEVGELNILIGNVKSDPNDPQGVIADGTFALPGNYTLRKGSNLIATGFPDFNHDGFDDIAVENEGDGTISVLLGQGDGTFDLPSTVDFGGNLSSVGVGDFTHSGHTDLVGEIDNNLAVALGNGNGTFQFRQTFTNITGDGVSLTVADFNADGWLDVALAGPTGVTVFLNAKGDTTAPKAAVATPLMNVTSPGGISYTFKVKYTDDKAVNVSTLDTGEIRVVGPHGYSQLAALVSVDSDGNGTPRTATYRVTPPGGAWDAGDNGAYTVSLVGGKVADTSGNLATGATLGTFSVTIMAGSIGGFVFNDVNSNGIRDAGDAFTANVRVYLDMNKNGVFDKTDKSTLTDSVGHYNFANLPAGIYPVREVVPAAHRISSPSAGYYDVALVAGQVFANKTFANTARPLLAGTVFNDTNGNKLRDTLKNVLEPGLANWRVYIDANSNGVFDSGEVSTLTDASGNWVFKTLQARKAAYIVRVSSQIGWGRTTPTGGTFSVVLSVGGEIKTGLLFGEKRSMGL